MMLVVRKTDKGDCMMKSIVEEKLVSFKELEQKLFKVLGTVNNMTNFAIRDILLKKIFKGRILC